MWLAGSYQQQLQVTVRVGWCFGLWEGRARPSNVLLIVLGGVPVSLGSISFGSKEPSWGLLRLRQREGSSRGDCDPLARGAVRRRGLLDAIVA